MKSSLGVTLLCTMFLSTPSSGAPLGKGGEEFVGTSPCGALPRAFLGGIAPGAACEAIKWKFTLQKTNTEPSTWQLSAGYELPAPGRPGHLIEGPRVSLEGRWEHGQSARSNSSAATYRLKTGSPERSLQLVRVGDAVLQLLAEDKGLLTGTSGWSYTLNRADRAERVASDAPAPDMSYAISPRATGPVFGVFEGRSPCTGIARALGLQEPRGCIKVKWRVTLNQDPATLAPTTYKVEGSLHRQRAREGPWTIVRGSAGEGSMVYRLDATKTEAPLLLMKGDDNVLFFLDQEQRLLIGNGDFSYTLNRVPGR